MSRGNILINLYFKIFGEIISKYFVYFLSAALLINEMILKPKMGLT